MTSPSPRETPSLTPPPTEPRKLEGFPAATLREGFRLVRVTRRGRNPWWFSSRGGGRFDLPAPEGTCYLAIDELSALLEVLGKNLATTICSELLESRQMHRLAMPVLVELADLGHLGARRFGVTAEIHTLVPYALPQRWAQALRGVGYDGVRYHVRHDPGMGEGVALFGPAGERTTWPKGDARPCDDPEICQRLLRLCGIRVVPRPTLEQLQVED